MLLVGKLPLAFNRIDSIGQMSLKAPVDEEIELISRQSGSFIFKRGYTRFRPRSPHSGRYFNGRRGPLSEMGYDCESSPPKWQQSKTLVMANWVRCTFYNYLLITLGISKIYKTTFNMF